MTTPSDQEMLEINTFKSLIHRAIQFEYASWCKERDKKRAREISLESGNEDKDASDKKADTFGDSAEKAGEEV